MGDTVFIGGPSYAEHLRMQGVEWLEEPEIRLYGGDPIKVYAVSDDPHGIEGKIPAGFVSTVAGRSTILGEFSGRPTGEYMPCNTVKGWAGGNEVYNKNVSTDMPFSGIRTAIAQRRAASAVKSRLS